jgi:hypothetical protein
MVSDLLPFARFARLCPFFTFFDGAGISFSTIQNKTWPQSALMLVAAIGHG